MHGFSAPHGPAISIQLLVDLSRQGLFDHLVFQRGAGMSDAHYLMTRTRPVKQFEFKAEPNAHDVPERYVKELRLFIEEARRATTH